MNVISKSAYIVTVSMLLLSGCQRSNDTVYPGYAEGEYVRIASPYAGSLTNLAVKRGEQIAANQTLFSLEQESERASREEALAKVKQAQSQLADKRKGKRPEEIAATRAQLIQAEAAMKLSESELRRTESLVASKFLSPSKLDEARSNLDRDRGKVAELAAQLKVNQLASRSDDIDAQTATVNAAREQLSQAEWRLAQKSQFAPKAALVVDTLYTQGEWVQAGMPVVSLLPPENIKLKFFVPEKYLGTLKIGQEVHVTCDGCVPLKANISYIAPQAEYTAPLIYSKENRATLVFLVEARPRPADAIKLHPGQPVEIAP